MIWGRLAVPLVVITVAAGCLHRPPEANNSPPVTRPWVVSQDGMWRVSWTTTPSTPRLNETFAMEVWIRPESGPPASVAPVALSFDARMPHHRHGMNQRPTVVKDESNPWKWRIDGVRLHMPGTWFYYWDIDDGTIVERALHRFELLP